MQYKTFLLVSCYVWVISDNKFQFSKFQIAVGILEKCWDIRL